MFEDKTFDNLMATMLENVSSRDPDLDTRIGSMIYTALAPIALELELVYHEMDMILEETFLETASKEYLVKHGNQIGVPLNDATYGYFQGEFDANVEIGSRFNLDKFNYSVIAKKSVPTDDYPYYVCDLVCETAGSEPNSYLGDLTPITYVANLSYAKLTSVLIYGEDEEETEQYRYRLQTHVNKPPINGNVAHYEELLSEYDGIGKYKVTPCWNGVNTVKLRITNVDNKAASEELIAEVQDYFDPPTDTINDDANAENYPQGRGMGNGEAVIGSIVTVDTVTEVPVVVNCTVKLKDGYSTPVGLVESVESYIDSVALKKNTIGYLPIVASMYDAESIDDVINATITVNGVELSTTSQTLSVTLDDGEVAVLDKDNSVWEVIS